MMKTKWLLMMLAATIFAVGNVTLGDIVTRSIQTDLDDAEEFLNTAEHHGWTSPEYAQGNGWLDSSDLEVGDDGAKFWQVCAVQYDLLDIPTGSLITSAKVTLTVDEAGIAGESNDFTILAEASGNASVFGDAGGGWLVPFDITSRARSIASVSWNPPLGAAVGTTVDTPDISALIQEVVNQPGWSDNNRLTLMIYPDVYLALPDPTTGGPTVLSTTVYEAGPGSDSATLTVEFNSEKKFFATNPDPANTTIIATSNLELSWTNADPNKPGDPVYVDVWFGTDPNQDPGANWTKVVSAGENQTSVLVDASADGTYCWQVNTYRYGSPTGDPCDSLGTVWRFYAVSDLPPTVEIDTPDMITWSGQAVSLDATVTDDGESALTYLWTSDPNKGVVFTPSASVEDPTVTITDPCYSPTGEITILDPVAINIANAGFEDRVLNDGAVVWWRTNQNTGWYYADQDGSLGGSAYNAGVGMFQWNPGLDAIPGNWTWNGFGGIAPEGNNVIAVTHDEQGAANLLTETFDHTKVYQLTAQVAGLEDSYWGWWLGYGLEILVGGSIEGPTNPGYKTIEGGTRIAYVEKTEEECGFENETFYPVSLTYIPDEADAALDGQRLQIRVMSHPDNGYAFFDDVKLVKGTEYIGTDIGGEAVVTLTLAVNDEGNPTPVTDTMKIYVYPDACAAARLGLGMDYEFDYDENCVIDNLDLGEMTATWPVDATLEDYAAMAAKWLVDYALTAPVAKP